MKAMFWLWSCRLPLSSPRSPNWRQGPTDGRSVQPKRLFPNTLASVFLTEYSLWTSHKIEKKMMCKGVVGVFSLHTQNLKEFLALEYNVGKELGKGMRPFFHLLVPKRGMLKLSMSRKWKKRRQKYTKEFLGKQDLLFFCCKSTFLFASEQEVSVLTLFVVYE